MSVFRCTDTIPEDSYEMDLDDMFDEFDGRNRVLQRQQQPCRHRMPIADRKNFKQPNDDCCTLGDALKQLAEPKQQLGAATHLPPIPSSYGDSSSRVWCERCCSSSSSGRCSSGGSLTATKTNHQQQQQPQRHPSESPITVAKRHGDDEMPPKPKYPIGSTQKNHNINTINNNAKASAGVSSIAGATATTGSSSNNNKRLPPIGKANSGSGSSSSVSLTKRNEWAAKRGAYSFMQLSLNKMNVGTSRAGVRYGKGNYQSQSNGGTDLESQSALPNNGEVTAEQVSAYLRANPDFLEHHIMDEVELEQLERWMIRRTQRARKQTLPMGKNGRKTSLSRWKFCVHADKRQMLLDLTHSLQLRPTRAHVLFELANCISSAVGADDFRLYLAEAGDTDTLTLYIGQDCYENGEPKMQKVIRNGGGLTVPTYVARTREAIRLSRGDVDPRFPDGILNKGDVAHILCQPITQPDGDLVAVLELIRKEDGLPFHEEDEEIACSYLVWGGIALHYAHLFMNINKQRKLNDFLLAVVKSIFQDMVSMDMLVIKIMNFAQRLVDADRASLFLVDSKSKELYATIFDVGSDSNAAANKNSDEEQSQPPSREIRFPIGTGIAGQVALSGEILNIVDAYSDPRFNRTVDAITGYKTETILCMPIYIRGSLIGVVQMVNKRYGSFTKEDEEAFQMFAVYCGLALHHAKLYDKIRRSEQKYRVALEVLSYHNTCTQEEVDYCMDEGIPKTVVDIDQYSFNPFDFDDFGKAKCAIYMFIDLFGLQRFDQTSLIRFTLTIRKNYRRVPYHNWTHGFSVANTMYSIIKNSVDAFRPNERLALFIGSLCHDLDHRGKNNKFMLDSESPIAAIYSTSTMEHHHFNQTVTILQQEGHNIFGKLCSVEYKQVLSLVKHCILATDLALFFPNKAKLTMLMEQEKFSWSILEHRMLIQAIAMTASDLSASAKPWEVQVKTVKVIFEEFYQQGDAEREAGRTPIAMMDRHQPDQQAASQVGFLNGICIPCYSLLNRLIPETKPLLDMCTANVEKWQEIANEMQRRRDVKAAAAKAAKEREMIQN